MNQVIKEIWNKAMKLTNETVSRDLGKDYFLEHEKVLYENFAKLLVAKCANVADTAQDVESEDPGDYLVDAMGFGKIDVDVAKWREDMEKAF